ncbi:hypothetical protein VTJ83DRAFT_937 [Remersonia thermophila]|uniref:Uncharacterized protein n=1 Tax=Remersonia thermophila TaxID=72144 RepID=A0ABR4DND8_9PEZI
MKPDVSWDLPLRPSPRRRGAAPSGTHTKPCFLHFAGCREAGGGNLRLSRRRGETPKETKRGAWKKSSCNGTHPVHSRHAQSRRYQVRDSAQAGRYVPWIRLGT